MGLAKPAFTPQEAEALAAAAQHTLQEEATATLALGRDPQKIQNALRALDKLRQHCKNGNGRT